MKLTLLSGAEWPVTLSDVLLTLGILLLLSEVIKGARPGAKYLTDHLLSLIVFGAAAAEFVLWPKFGTSTYFLLTGLSLVDFLSGLALRTRRRAVAVATPAPSKKRAEKTEAPAAEPQFDPPAPAACDPACHSCCPFRPGGSFGRRIRAVGSSRTETGATCRRARCCLDESPVSRGPSPAEVSSPEIPSPGIQPGSGSQPSPDKPDTPQR